VSVVVDRGRGSTTTNYEGLMMRVTCDIKRVNMMVRTCLEVVVHCPEGSDYLTVDGLLVLLVVMESKLILWKD